MEKMFKIDYKVSPSDIVKFTNDKIVDIGE